MDNQIIEKEFMSTAVSLKDQATAMKVVDVAGYTAAGELGKSLKELEKKVVYYFKPLKETAFAAHKAITAKESEELKPIKEAVQILRDSMNAYRREQERIRQEEERKARLAAEEDARKEREKLEAQALKAIEKGKEEKAEDLLERAENVYVAPVTVAPTVAKTVQTSAGNITQAVETRITVTDLKAFISELVKSNPGALPSIVDVKTAGVKNFVKSSGLERYPGLSITRSTSVRF